MKPSDMMPIEHDQAQMWKLSTDRRSVRPVAGLPEPVTVKIDFDAGVIDKIIEHLMVLRAQMLPAQPEPGKLELMSSDTYQPNCTRVAMLGISAVRPPAASFSPQTG